MNVTSAHCDKPLFLPLKGIYFDLFAGGAKDSEFRLYGPRWNEQTCRIGRPVVLSRGYGKHRRLRGVIRSFAKHDPRALGPLMQLAIRDCFGTLDKPVVKIGIEVQAVTTADCDSQIPAKRITAPEIARDLGFIASRGNFAPFGTITARMAPPDHACNCMEKGPKKQGVQTR